MKKSTSFKKTFKKCATHNPQSFEHDFCCGTKTSFMGRSDRCLIPVTCWPNANAVGSAYSLHLKESKWNTTQFSACFGHNLFTKMPRVQCSGEWTGYAIILLVRQCAGGVGRLWIASLGFLPFLVDIGRAFLVAQVLSHVVGTTSTWSHSSGKKFDVWLNNVSHDMYYELMRLTTKPYWRLRHQGSRSSRLIVPSASGPASRKYSLR